MRIRYPWVVQSRTGFAFLSKLGVQVRNDFFDDAPHGSALLRHFSLHRDVQSAVRWVRHLGISATYAQTPEEDTSTALTFHSAVVHASSANDSAQHVGAIHALGDELVDEDFLLPRILVLRHERRWILGKLRSHVGLRWSASRRRWHCRLHWLASWSLHVQDAVSDILHIHREEDIQLVQTLHEILHLLVVFGEIRVCKALKLDHELLQGG
mmetsp:Transcript_34170/g.61904  ORF Transcript_34170/g.61904 Transcript_34170/m.61904 type:complete len:211 (-) Transcript_34170:93-725(-)